MEKTMSIPSGFKPLNDNVLIRRIEAENKTAGGIFLPESAQEKPQIAIVEAANTTRTDEDGNGVGRCRGCGRSAVCLENLVKP